MLTAFSRWLPFTGTKPPALPLQRQASGDLEDDEIPRYPPFAKGLPVAPLDKVMLTQRELVSRIQQTLGLSQAESDELLRPVLENYASFVHLLPASEAHHHRGAGGLFRHGLEVAFWATQASEAIIFVRDGTPRQRREQEPCWRFAVCLAALLHDLGKPLSDVVVTNKAGSTEWNPYAETLLEWASENAVDRYFLRWNKGRHQRHERLATLALNMILTPAVRRYLRGPGPDLMKAVVEAISGTSALHPVTQLVLKADQESVKRDLRESRLSIDEHSIGLSIEPYIIDGIRSLVSSRRWKVNVSGAEVWNLEEGVFIAWRTASQSLVRHLQDKDIPAVPHDPDTLADYLIERGFAVPRPVPGSDADSDAYYRYWEVEPDPDAIEQGEMAMRAKIMMLRMEDRTLVFGNAENPPAAIPARITGVNDSQDVTGGDSGSPLGDGTEMPSSPQASGLEPSAAEQAPTVSPTDGSETEEEPAGGNADGPFCPHANMSGSQASPGNEAQAPTDTMADAGAEAPVAKVAPASTPAPQGSLLGRAPLATFGDGLGIDLGPGTSKPRKPAASPPTSEALTGPQVPPIVTASGNEPGISTGRTGEADPKAAEATPSSPALPEATPPNVADFASALSAGIGMDFPFAAEPGATPHSPEPEEEGEVGAEMEATHPLPEPSIDGLEGAGAEGPPAVKTLANTALSLDRRVPNAGVQVAENPAAPPRGSTEREARAHTSVPSALGGPLVGDNGKGAVPMDLDALLSPKASSGPSKAARPLLAPESNTSRVRTVSQEQASGEGRADRQSGAEKPRITRHERAGGEAAARAYSESVRQPQARQLDNDLSKDIPWRAYGEAGMVLRRIVKPILKREAALGVHLLKTDAEIALIWPDAAQAVSKPPVELQGLLVDNDMVALGEGGVIEQEREGFTVVVLCGELAQVIHQRLGQLEASIEATLEVSQAEVGSTNQEPVAEGRPAEPAATDRPTPKIVGRKRRKESAESGESVEVQHDAPPKAATVSSTPTLGESLHLVTNATPDRRDDAEANREFDISPPSLSLNEALARLHGMVLSGEGEWLVGSVRKEGDQWVTSALALDRIAGDYPNLTRTRLKNAIKTMRLGMWVIGSEQKLVVRSSP